jgi:DNA-directed RNA polymerase specialized sigma24 family protein
MLNIEEPPGSEIVEIPKSAGAALEYAPAEEIIEALEDSYKNIENFHKRLLYFTLKYIRFYFNTNCLREKSADDVVQTVIEKLITLKRKWYRKKIPNFHKFLRFAILSYIRNESRREVKEAVDLSVEVCDEEGNLSEEQLSELTSDILCKDINGKKSALDFENLLNKCEAEFEKNDTTFFVFELRLDGLRSNIEIAERLKVAGFEVDVRDVENSLKKIKYYINKVINQSIGR